MPTSTSPLSKPHHPTLPRQPSQEVDGAFALRRDLMPIEKIMPQIFEKLRSFDGWALSPVRGVRMIPRGKIIVLGSSTYTL